VTKIGPFQQEKLFKNPVERLEDIIIPLNQSKKLDNKLSKLIDLISNANELVIIYSNELISGEFENKVNELRKKEVRCYFLTPSKNFTKLQKNPYRDMIIRESNIEDHSSFIIIDPKSNPKGVWSSQPITKDITKVLNLTKTQIKEFYIWFVYNFWNSSSELFFGKLQKIKGIMLSEDEATNGISDMKNTVQFDLTTIDTNFFDMEQLCIPNNIITEIDDTLLIENSNAIIFPYSKLTQRLILENKDLGKEFFIGSTEELVIQLESESWIYGSDIGFKLSTKQKETVANWINSEHKYVKSIEVDKLTSEFLTSNDDWNVNSKKINYHSIVDQEEETIEPLMLSSISDWLNEYTLYNKDKDKPAIKTEISPSDKLHYAKTILVKRDVHPPTLRKSDGKKHPIYENWINFFVQNITLVESIVKVFDEVSNYEKSFEDKESKKLIDKYLKSNSKIVKELEDRKSNFSKFLEDKNNMANWDLSNLEEDSREINEKIELFKKQTKELETELEKQKIQDLNELEAINKEKAKLKGDRKKIIDYLKTFNGKNLRDIIIDLSKKPPYLPCKVGELWLSKNRNYIIISEIKEIEPAINLVDRYENAIVAILR
jgi:hypothetical protein